MTHSLSPLTESFQEVAQTHCRFTCSARVQGLLLLPCGPRRDTILRIPDPKGAISLRGFAKGYVLARDYKLGKFPDRQTDRRKGH